MSTRAGQDFEVEVQAGFWSWNLFSILPLGLVKILNFKFIGDADVWLRSWFLVEILKMKFDQDLCLNLWYDLRKLLWKDELNAWVRCAFGNFFYRYGIFWMPPGESSHLGGSYMQFIRTPQGALVVIAVKAISPSPRCPLHFAVFFLKLI